ncbi:MAG: sugar phosphate isomerase/epimerase [Oscillospiraceae bacterium]|nr:sugar phosphate isomerase/epimerase [Oscillospiraceae bacterium]
MPKLKNGIELSVQSYTFRNFKKREDLYKKVKECGLNALEICGTHVNFNDESDVDDYLKTSKEAGISTVSAGVNGFSFNENELKINFEFAKKAGIKVFGADVDLDAIALVEKYCDEYGVKLGIHNHGRHHRYGSYEQLDEIFSKSSKNIGLTLDTAWAIDSGINPKEMIEKYYDRLYGLHFKDMVYTDFEKGEFYEVPCGDGKLDIPGIAKLILDAPNLQYISIEYEGEPENPSPSVVKCVENIVKSLG